MYKLVNKFAKCCKMYANVQFFFIEMTKVTIEMTLKNVEVGDKFSQTDLDDVSSPAFKNLSKEITREVSFLSEIIRQHIMSFNL